jgi:hypothetical protein
VTPEFVAQMQETGLLTARPELFEDFSIHDVTLEFAKAVQELGFTDFTPDKLVDMRIHDVTADFARQMQKANPDISLEEIIDMKITGEMPQIA